MTHASNTDIEEMDDGEATSIDMPEIVGGDVMFPMAYSNDTEKEQENAELVEEIRQNLQKVPLSRPSIYRIPEFVFNENPAAYVPHMVSIGPFHHDQQHLQPMEARKMQYLTNFLCRQYTDKLPSYVKAIRGLVETAYQCYAELKAHDKADRGKRKKKEEKAHDRKSLVMMMVVDGCFILELLHRKPDTPSDEKWIFLVLLDLILLENQLPFIVLEALYKEFNKGSGDEAVAPKLTILMSHTFVPHILRLLLGDVKLNSTGDIELIEPKHLLDLVLQFLKPQSTWQLTAEQRIEETSVGRATERFHFAPACVRKLCQGDPLEEDNLTVRIRCATELEKAGVKFKKNKNPTSLLDIKFDSANGILTIPGIRIDHSTQSILRNLVAYEQYTDDYSYITEYAAFLDGLIDTRNDVEVLQKNGIIEPILGDPSEMAELFNSLLKDSAVCIYYTINVRQEVEQYYNKPWHKWKASLMLNYFNTPWSLISVIAAIILLVLTFTQTYYSAKPYIRFD